MKNNIYLFLLVGMIIIFTGCKETPPEVVAPEGPVMVMPITTSSPETKQILMSGIEAWDMGRNIDANAEFTKAVQNDPNFLMGHLLGSFTADSFEKFLKSFEKAEALASKGSDAEKILLQIVRANMDNNVDKALDLAQELVIANPESPRAHLWLAGGLAAVNKNEEAREIMVKAMELAPDFVPAYVQAGNNYLFNEPRDLKKAEEMFLKAADLAPEESNSYDLLGDVYRANGDLEKARDSYSKAAEYSGEDGSPYQQRGHVNSFLGHFDAARADYDKAISMARASEKEVFGVYKTYVNIHAGEPAKAIKELEAIVSETNNTSSILFALSSAFWIALHQDMNNKAQEIHYMWRTVRMQLAEIGGTDEMISNGKADVAYRDGLLACNKRHYKTAQQKAEELTALVEPDSDPRKMERVHQLKGAIALEQRNYAKAVEHFRQGDHQNDMYIKYLLGKSLEGAGEMEEAMALYNDVATHNFNGVGEALARQEIFPKIR